MSSNHISKIAIVGAGGRVGAFITKSLLKTGKHHVTALTRPDSGSKLPAGLHSKAVSLDDKAAIAEALKGQDALIITMAASNRDQQQTFNLIDAAAEAGVKFVMPNEWGGDTEDERLKRDSMLIQGYLQIRDYIRQAGKGKMHFVALTCGFWYEFSLVGLEERYGFDFKNKTVTYFSGGDTKLPTSTWDLCGEAVAKLFSLPIQPVEGEKGPFLADFADKAVYISSFHISQKEMLASILRVTGDEEADWTVKHEDVQERFRRGMETMKTGNLMGFLLALYARGFYPDGSADFQAKVENEKLGLPKEDLDEATGRALKIVESGQDLSNPKAVW